jgi:hypothetical protein
MAERILHFESVQSKEESEKVGGDSAINLILVSLAIEHSRRFVVYGMMETKNTTVDFFQTYFRMTEIAKRDDGERETTFLAIDLEKCNYRYALLKRREEISRGRLIAANDSSSQKSERMLVVLPSLQKATKTCSTTTTESVVYKVKNEDVCHFTSIERKSSIKKIVLKLNKINGAIVKTLRESQKSDENNLLKPEESLDFGDMNWNVLRSFPVLLTRKAISRDGDKINEGEKEGITIAAELKRLQNELTRLENNQLPSLLSLYRCTHDERTKYELGLGERAQAKTTLKHYEGILDRRREAQKAWELQQEQDDNAVCDICHDGESTGENRIIFCDSCNISVHQSCYGILKVPTGDFFCHACLYFKRNSSVNCDPRNKADRKPPPLPIYCEVCPRRQGAFIQTKVKQTKKRRKSESPKWIHVVCAKWHGLRFVDRKTDEIIPYGDMVEDVTELKNYFRLNNYQCCLCEGMRGCYVQCSVEGCDKSMHITCARSSGLCNVTHGTNHLGAVESQEAWSLTCPDHSTIDPEVKPPGTAHLRSLAKTFPPEPKPAPPPKPFYKMTKRERDQHLADPEFEEEFLEALMKKINISRCEVCYQPYVPLEQLTDNDEVGLMRCHICHSVAHTSCLTQNWDVQKIRNGAPKITCTRCMFVERERNASSTDFRMPECHMCNSKHGSLIEARATPMSMKKWKDKRTAFKRSLFGQKIWCHPVCGM